MTFNWLPDAELDPHPRLTWLVECSFDLAVLMLFRKEEIYPPGYRLEPGTFVVSNHQRDTDVPILTTTLCRREGLHIRWPLPFYATREDLFRKGFLADLLAHWPPPLPQLLGWVPLSWLFRIVRAEPMRRIREFTLGETSAALVAAGFGETDPRKLLSARGKREIGGRLGRLPDEFSGITAHRLGALRRSFWGLRRVRSTSIASLAPEFTATIARQLARFAALLDAGRIVYFAPEGTISDTGRFGRFRAGTWRLYRLAAAPPPLLPCAMSYDPLGPGRLRTVVRIGQTRHGPVAADKRTFDALVRRSILELYAATPSHLLARFLAAGPRAFSSADCVEWLRRTTAELAAAGLTVDPLLARVATERLAAERLDWLARKGLVARSRDGWTNRWPRETQPGWNTPARVVAYLHAALGEFDDLVPQLQRRLVP